MTDLARRTRRQTLDERNLLILAWISAGGLEAHLEPPQRPDPLFPAVLCVHTPAGQLAWRLTADEIPEFSHLPTRPVSHFDGATPHEKHNRLERLARPANAAPTPTSEVLAALSLKVDALPLTVLTRMEQRALAQLRRKPRGKYAVYIEPAGEDVRLARYQIGEYLDMDALKRPISRLDGWLYAGTLTKR